MEDNWTEDPVTKAKAEATPEEAIPNHEIIRYKEGTCQRKYVFRFVLGAVIIMLFFS